MDMEWYDHEAEQHDKMLDELDSRFPELGYTDRYVAQLKNDWCEYEEMIEEEQLVKSLPDEVFKNRVACISCGVQKHPANMCDTSQGWYCQKCRWGL